jgi:hypothetical protein
VPDKVNSRARWEDTPGLGGGDRIRTDDRLVANQELYQLSYAPWEDPGCAIEGSPSSLPGPGGLEADRSGGPAWI